MQEEQELSAVEPDETAALRYLDASKVDCPGGDLSSMDVRGAHGQEIGRVAGVLIDPGHRRLRFFVVAARMATGRRYLLPTDAVGQMDPDRKFLRLDVDPEDLPQYPEFIRSLAPDFSDSDLLDAMFCKRSD